MQLYETIFGVNENCQRHRAFDVAMMMDRGIFETQVPLQFVMTNTHADIHMNLSARHVNVIANLLDIYRVNVRGNPGTIPITDQ